MVPAGSIVVSSRTRCCPLTTALVVAPTPLQSAHAWVLGSQFWVHPDAFLVHVPHGKSEAQRGHDVTVLRRRQRIQRPSIFDGRHDHVDTASEPVVGSGMGDIARQWRHRHMGRSSSLQGAADPAMRREHDMLAADHKQRLLLATGGRAARRKLLEHGGGGGGASQSRRALAAQAAAHVARVDRLFKRFVRHMQRGQYKTLQVGEARIHCTLGWEGTYSEEAASRDLHASFVVGWMVCWSLAGQTV
jgi:hypothetical protein